MQKHLAVSEETYSKVMRLKEKLEADMHGAKMSHDALICYMYNKTLGDKHGTDGTK